MGEAGPALYTVEEAARLLRVGRTKAYAMTQEWRATGGRSGLPVVDFGNVLRVPRAALEQLLGGVELGPAPTGSGASGPDPAPPPAPGPAAAASDGRRPARSRVTRRTAGSQLDLFDAAS